MPGPEAAVRDTVGAATLERIAEAPAFNQWMYERLARWIGGRVLEVGAGIGNISRFLIDRPRVVLTDTDPEYRATLRDRFGHLPHVDVAELTLPTISPALADQQFDSIVCLNVLEHIEDDGGALAAMRTLLAPKGRLVLLVPALPSLYGTLDRALGHYRRYTRRALRERYRSVDLAMAHLEYFNLAGLPGWFFVGRMLRRSLIPRASLRAYDRLVPLVRLERLLPWRVGQSLIAIGERTE